MLTCKIFFSNEPVLVSAALLELRSTMCRIMNLADSVLPAPDSPLGGRVD
jgi:hypothetical protein